MKLLLVHLSDIHLTDERDGVLNRFHKIGDAIRTRAAGVEMCCVVVSGDIAFSGTAEQYGLAMPTLQDLKARLDTDLRGVPVELVLIPGNHDCDFSSADSTRLLLLDTLVSRGDVAVQPAMVSVCTEPQRQFFELRTQVASVGLAEKGNLYWEYRFECGKEAVLFRCLNTAWASRKREVQGQLFFPPEEVRESDKPAAVVVTVLHHPYNWFGAVNARILRKRIESVSDVILTGHEHDATIRAQRGMLGETNLYIEGAALQENHDRAVSAFNLLILETEKRRQQFFRFEWNGGLYEPIVGDPEWEDYQANRLRLASEYELTASMAAYLDDLGIVVSHPAKGNVDLHDVFVYPDLIEAMYRHDRSPRSIRGERVIEFSETHPRILISGTDDCGKSTFAKRLFLDFLASGFVPVILSPREDRFSADEKMFASCTRAFTRQYRTPSGEHYRQLGREQRVVIVDEFHLLRLKRGEADEVLARLTEFGGRVILFAHDLTHQVTSVIRQDLAAEGKLGFSEFRIQPCGHVRRNELAEKWFALDDSPSIDPADLARRVVEAKVAMDTAVGNFLPAYPALLLPILQALQHNEAVNTSASAYGYFYELLIRRSLASGATNEAMGVKLGYLTFLAASMVDLGVTEITELQLRDIHAAYEKQYLLTIPFRGMIDDLIAAKVLEETKAGFRFRYPYIRYYFIALGLRDQIGSASTREQIQKHVEHIDQEESANILLFLAHLTRDPFVIDTMLEAAGRVFSDLKPAELQKATSPMLAVDKQLSNSVYEEVEDARRRMLETLDRLEATTGEYLARDSRAVNGSKEDRELASINAYLVKVGASLRTLQILGQMLKNFVGVMDGETKLRLTRECIGIGLRTLSSYLRLLEEGGTESYIKGLVELLRAEDPNLTNEEVSRRARASLFGLVHAATYGLIKRVAVAIGSPDLVTVYELVRDEWDVPSVALIHTSLQLDQFTEFPEGEVVATYSQLDNNPLANSVLRSLVVNHFHIFDVPFAVKQRACAKLEIEYKPSLGADPQKKLLSKG